MKSCMIDQFVITKWVDNDYDRSNGWKYANILIGESGGKKLIESKMRSHNQKYVYTDVTTKIIQIQIKV